MLSVPYLLYSTVLTVHIRRDEENTHFGGGLREMKLHSSPPFSTGPLGCDSNPNRLRRQGGDGVQLWSVVLLRAETFQSRRRGSDSSDSAV